MKRHFSSVAEQIRRKIEEQGEGYWQYAHFCDLPTAAVSKALSRLVQEGFLERVSKGLYYHPRVTRFGRTLPCRGDIQQLATKHNLRPAGLSAASLLGFTTQNAVHGEFATSAHSVPRTLIGDRAIIHTRRPSSWNDLSATDAALLDFLRSRGKLSELSPTQTKRRLLDYFQDSDDRFNLLAEVAQTEPPRVRAMLGAIGQELGKSRQTLEKLRKGLNPLSRFEFGNLSELSYAKEWLAK